MQKAGLKMPEAFLKRWLYTINEGKFSMEDIDKDFDQFLKMFTWNYLQKHFIKQDNITVTKDEALAEAKALAAAQFAQYGMPSAPEDMLAGYAEKILADKDQGQKIYEKAVRSEGRGGCEVEDQGDGKSRICRRFRQIGQGALVFAEKRLSLDFAGVMFAKSFCLTIYRL